MCLSVSGVFPPHTLQLNIYILYQTVSEINQNPKPSLAMQQQHKKIGK